MQREVEKITNDQEKPIGFDTSGFEVLQKAVLDLLNQYPGLNGKEILFEVLNPEYGNIAFSSDNGALVMSETEDILGGINQKCQYPFYIVYRTASADEKQKLRVVTFLDSLGKWLCKEPAEINGKMHIISSYPDLSQGRKITRVTRSIAYGLEPTPDAVQDWLLPVTVFYKNYIEP